MTNDISQVPLLAEWVRELGMRLNLPVSAVFRLNLALEEAVVNVMKYAYPDKKECPITISAEVVSDEADSTERIVFVLTDEGVPFDPTQAKYPDITLPAEARRIGGLGIFLVEQLMECVQYERAGQKNVLTMIYFINRDTVTL